MKDAYHILHGESRLICRSRIKKGNDFIENEGCGNQIRGFAGAEVSPVGDGLRMVLVVLRFNGYDIAGVKK
jgi:hypothetical protein